MAGLHNARNDQGPDRDRIEEAFLAAQESEDLAESYDWAIDKRQYIAFLRDYDVTRGPMPLATFMPVRHLDE
ncbi:hypothetical protein VD659_18110 [Herbiconiux sp. 11R-BC]|uniref:hypothetical protein n=1 Tax=Herbiconiux sp. 11R-BC TaxID=3111637 RepID=UPI003C031230